jgi:Glycosyl hydrolases family 16
MPRQRGIILAAAVAVAAALGLVGVLVVRPGAAPDTVQLAAGGPTTRLGAPVPPAAAPTTEQAPTLPPITPTAVTGPPGGPAGPPAGQDAPAGRPAPPAAALPGSTASTPGRGRSPGTSPSRGGAATPDVRTDGTQAARLFGWGQVVAGDEFGGTRLDTGRWSVYSGASGSGRRLPSQVSVGGGVLTITGRPDGDTGGIALRSGQRYGRWEARMRVTQAGGGNHPYHPALLLWPDSGQWPAGGEIDYAEADAGAHAVSAYLHYANGTPGGAQESHETLVDLSGWHNYALEWTPDHVAGYVDGRLWFRTTSNSVQPPGPMHQAIQLDALAGAPLSGAELNVAWLRVYSG